MIDAATAPSTELTIACRLSAKSPMRRALAGRTARRAVAVRAHVDDLEVFARRNDRAVAGQTFEHAAEAHRIGRADAARGGRAARARVLVRPVVDRVRAELLHVVELGDREL